MQSCCIKTKNNWKSRTILSILLPVFDLSQIYLLPQCGIRWLRLHFSNLGAAPAWFSESRIRNQPSLEEWTHVDAYSDLPQSPGLFTIALKIWKAETQCPKRALAKWFATKTAVSIKGHQISTFSSLQVTTPLCQRQIQVNLIRLVILGLERNLTTNSWHWRKTLAANTWKI